ncbi:amidohydrolase family protein [Actinokineospora auranticolor]|uniref:Cytosine/adenosine deaminase-related metal-dependent hydrolase n=1 Tax=Actinokineospora auranticolor TaxID=155976 RepID=A0A2S6GJ69_9PSEU|nr:amidohydrolase family protein [Actinokineospora auranticolor]PPK65201.1 cytosine/adenosine deaminase-related metal-dependent hydrolase [Actinokineospora auranticolor]
MRLVLRGGFVVAVDPDIGVLPGADVVVEHGLITYVGPDGGDGEVVDVSGQVVLPGFVDSHRHVWQAPLRGLTADLTLAGYLPLVLGTLAGRHSPDDLRTATLLGAAEALDAGITTVVDWSNPATTADHAAAAVDALRTTGIRAVYAYGDADDEATIRALHRDLPASTTSLAIATLGPDFGPVEDTARHLALARDLGVPTTMHLHDGRGLEPVLDALGPDTQLVHANALPDALLARLAARGCPISVTPCVESTMGHGRPILDRAQAHGARAGLGVDVVTTSPAGMFDQLRSALAQRRLTTPSATETHPPAADLLRSATLDSAATIGLANRTGSITPGKRADLITVTGYAGLINVAPDVVPSAVVATATAADVANVLVDGHFRKRDGKLAHDLHHFRTAADDLLRRIFPTA